MEFDMTMSVGAAQSMEGQPLDRVISLADAALYRAKNNGRAREEFAEAEVVPLDCDAGGRR